MMRLDRTLLLGVLLGCLLSIASLALLPQASFLFTAGIRPVPGYPQPPFRPCSSMCPKQPSSFAATESSPVKSETLAFQSTQAAYASLRSLPEARPSRFSSFECTAGSQRFLTEEFTLQATQRPNFPEAGSTAMRTCLLRDVCIHGSEILYYEDEELESSTPFLFHLSAFNLSRGIFFQETPPYADGMFFRGYLPQTLGEATVPTTVHGPRPEHYKVLRSDRMYVLDEISYGYNYGHVLIDSILPAYSIAEVYGVDIENVQMVGWRSCETLRVDTDPSLCRVNMARWMNNLFDHPYLEPPYKEPVCFRQLLVGQSGSMALNGMYLHRSQTIRKARLRLHQRLGVPAISRFTAHTVVVHRKRQVVHATQFSFLCESVKEWAQHLSPVPHVICSWTADLEPKEQLERAFGAFSTLAFRYPFPLPLTFFQLFLPPCYSDSQCNCDSG